MKLEDCPPLAECNRIISEWLGLRYYKFCGPEDAAHEPYVFEPQSETSRGLMSLAGEQLIRCRKCDGSKWASRQQWEPSAEAGENQNFTGSRDAMASALVRLQPHWQTYYTTTLYLLAIPEAEQYADHFISFDLAFKIAQAGPELQAAALARIITDGISAEIIK